MIVRTVCFPLIILCAVPASAIELPFNVVPGERQLVLDDAGIAKVENLTRTMHRPRKKGAVIRPNWPLGVKSVQARTAPVWDPQEKVFKFWDCAATPPGLSAQGIGGSGYYESTDGLHWSQPPLGQMEFKEWPLNNYIKLTLNGKHYRTDYVAYDPVDPDPTRRFKCALPPHGFAVSPNGRDWRAVDGPSIPSGDEANFSFDHKGKLFILTVKRPGPNGRSVYLATSKDFTNWTDHGLIFHSDDLDQEIGRKRILVRSADPTLQQIVANDPSRWNTDVYNMGVFRYESIYIGTPTMYHATGPSADGTNTDGFHLVELACSRDLKNWLRLGDREPFIGASRLDSGAYDLTGMIGPSNAVVRGDELWLYYTAGKYRRSPAEPDFDDGAVCLAVLRRDGFVSLDATESVGTVLTKRFVLPSTKLLVNIKATAGEAQIELLDENDKGVARSTRMTGDLLRTPVEWEAGDLATLKGKSVSLRIQLRNAQLYSYWVE